jgi:pimeloyl-ACP methyl ester carboxylesterase
VTIIAHSNGGLVAKALLAKLGTVETEQLVGKLILVASPQAGTPQAIAGLLHGYGLAVPAEKFPTALSDAAARDAGDTMPGLYALLPSDAYFETVQDPVATFSTTTLLSWAYKYGAEVHSTANQRGFVSDVTRATPSYGDLVTPAVINDAYVSAARALHQTIDSWQAPASVRVIQIAGWGIPNTVSGIHYSTKFENGTSSLAADPDFVIDGDGTVVTPSALVMSTSSSNVERYWVDLNSYNNKHFLETLGGYLPYSHANILEITNLRSFLTDTFSSSTKHLVEYKYLTDVAPASTDKRLRYALHSPLTLNLYDSEGRHTGISTSTGEVVEEVPGTHYSEFAGVKYIFTDATSSSHIVMNGYAAGTFTLNVDEYQGATRVASTTFANVPTTASTTVVLDTQSDISTLSSLSVDQNSDGTPDIVVVPVQNGSANLDTAAPTTTANIVGPAGLGGWFLGTTTISLVAADAASGVQATYISVDGATTTATSTSISAEGVHLVGYYSTDLSGNAEDVHAFGRYTRTYR